MPYHWKAFSLFGPHPALFASAILLGIGIIKDALGLDLFILSVGLPPPPALTIFFIPDFPAGVYSIIVNLTISYSLPI